MRKSFAFLSVVPIILSCSDAWAEALNEEVIRHQSLLMLGEVTQAASVSYGYAAHTALGRSTSSKDMSEGYGISTQAAVMDPDILLMQISAGVSYQQQLGKSSTLLNYHYNLVGNAFQLSSHPILISNTRTSTVISNGYTPSYTLERTGNRISGSLLNQIVPVRMFYAHSTVATKGLAVDTSGVSDTAGMSVHYGSGDTSSTDASLSFDSGKSEEKESRSYTAFLVNKLNLDAKKRYQLLTKAAFSDSLSAEVPQQQASISGALSGRLGKALTGTLTEQYSYSSTVDFDNNEQTVKSNAVSAGLSHRLFESLTTSVSTSVGKTSALGGDESSRSANAMFAYQKMLPSQSRLSITGNFGRSVTKQNFEDTELSARDESHLVVQQGDSITPNLVGRLVEVVSVKSLDPEIIYLEGADYRVNQATGRIEIVVNGAIAPGTTVYISYTVATNPNLDFESATQSYLGILSLYGGRYTISADYSQSSQKRISGEEQVAALVDSKAINLRGQAQYANSSVAVEYGNVSSTQESLSRIGANWAYDTHFYSNDTVRINARDVYSMYDDSPNSKGYSENLATLSVSYNRSLFNWLRLALATNLNDSRKEGSSSNLVMFRTGLEGNYNRIAVSLSGQTTYRIAKGNNTRDDAFHFKITRYF